MGGGVGRGVGGGDFVHTISTCDALVQEVNQAYTVSGEGWSTMMPAKYNPSKVLGVLGGCGSEDSTNGCACSPPPPFPYRCKCWSGHHRG